jgi:hypothetical protein
LQIVCPHANNFILFVLTFLLCQHSFLFPQKLVAAVMGCVTVRKAGGFFATEWCQNGQ